MAAARLVVLRGPSGAGKSTLARQLFQLAPSGTALIEQDYYRRMFKPAGGQPGTRTVEKLILHNVLTALTDGSDVILEGILNKRAYGDMFSEIFNQHPNDNYLFYFDIRFEECFKRYRARHADNQYTEQEVHSWYKAKDLLGYDFEQVIPESSSEAQTLAMIRNATGLSGACSRASAEGRATTEERAQSLAARSGR